MLVSEVMHEGVTVAQVTDSIKTVAQLMRDNDIGAVPIYDNEKPAGFVTDRDIVISCVADGASLDGAISEAMSPEFIAIAKDKDVTEAARIMEDKQISRLLVVDGNKPVGIVSLQDLAQGTENPELKSEVLQEIKH
ncbi:CBS domain-containing protein [Peredibacter starrii]|uniref:CBS domain-containing protein n=1 Tax=Peredibacter starrii TaxID=28202 RepID=A0AAX4HTS6_9BACT|nr:CBS domain-containing protein [Peredibacter starrii]WPU66692.1 CBS domain-containing protein [Peredibacter starrii]